MVITVHVLMTFVFCIHILTTRPYRTFSTNMLYILSMISFTIMLSLMYMKVQGYEQSVFIDKYFFLLTLFLSGFLWFMVVLFLLYILVMRHKWPLDYRTVKDLTDGQETAIYYIKDARAFLGYIMNKKKYVEADSERMDTFIEKLTLQFNNFRGAQPLIMDSLLETIDSLRLL